MMKLISTKNIKENTLKLNSFALKSTEKMFSKTIDSAEDLQKFTSKTIQHSLKFSAKKQDNFFNNLEKGKGIFWKKLNKTIDFFSKN
ncbi:hypothetical protein [uncultured Polaribacter sp.]|uniref:hypothetical protein n=1 Tax=uncultured Polaribacter sp. TaxID=174711 RepID=UPI0030D80056